MSRHKNREQSGEELQHMDTQVSSIGIPGTTLIMENLYIIGQDEIIQGGLSVTLSKV